MWLRCVVRGKGWMEAGGRACHSSQLHIPTNRIDRPTRQPPHVHIYRGNECIHQPMPLRTCCSQAASSSAASALVTVFPPCVVLSYSPATVCWIVVIIVILHTDDDDLIHVSTCVCVCVVLACVVCWLRFAHRGGDSPCVYVWHDTLHLVTSDSWVPPHACGTSLNTHTHMITRPPHTCTWSQNASMSSSFPSPSSCCARQRDSKSMFCMRFIGCACVCK